MKNYKLIIKHNLKCKVFVILHQTRLQDLLYH